MAKRPRTVKQMLQIREAQKASVIANRARANAPKPVRKVTKAEAARLRGSGVPGLKRNTVPYLRVNKRSGTVGVNAGTIVGPDSRIVLGGYARVERIKRVTPVDKALERTLSSKYVAPWGTKRGKAAKWLSKNVHVTNPGTRITAGKVQARIGTSRKAGPTLVLRRGKHPIKQSKSAKGIRMYDDRMRTIARRKAHKERPQRRGKGVL
jgi:hypothetical protein